MIFKNIEGELSFSNELLAMVEDLSTTDNLEAKKEASKKLKIEYKNLNKELKPLVKEAMANVKLKYKELSNGVCLEFQTKLEEINKNPRNTKEEKRQYNELLNGIKIQKKRALKTLLRERLQEELDCKRAFIDLRNALNKEISRLGLKESFF